MENPFKNPEQEKNLPEILTGQETADLAENLYSRVSPEFAKNLVHSNVALTLAGLKPQTEFFIDVNSEFGMNEVVKDIESANSYFNEVGAPVKLGVYPEVLEGRLPNNSSFVMVNFVNLHGLERLSKTSKFSGVEAFDSSLGFENPDHNLGSQPRILGFERVQEWTLKFKTILEKAQAEGQITQDCDVEIIFDGLFKGYPYQATEDFSWAHKNDQMDKLVVVPIRGIGTYDEAEPSYDCLPEHLDDTDIRENVRQAEEILDAFYGSDWHQSLNLEKFKPEE